MKRTGNLYEKICSMENIELAYQNARKNKTGYKVVKNIDANTNHYLLQVKCLLDTKSFCNAEYSHFERKERGKVRLISRLPFFPDRIIHHCIVQVLCPIWEKTYIHDTYASIKGRGLHCGVKRVKKALLDKENTRFCLKLDVRKFYQNIDHDVLKQLLSRKIKDRETLNLLSIIIDSSEGLPIGNYLSQHMANFYLSEFDHFVKEKLKIHYYFRYCDDLILLHSSKEYLHHCRREIGKYLSERLKLELKSNYQVFPVSSRGIDFLGYIFFHTHTLIRKGIKQRMIRTIRKNKLNITESKASYSGWLIHANTHNLKMKYLKTA